MPTVPVTINQLPGNGLEIDSITWTNAQAGSGDNDMDNDGRTLLFVRNVNAATRTVTLAGVADPYGRLSSTVLNLAALTGFAVAGPFPQPLFNIGATGRMSIVPSASASGGDFQLAAIRLPVF